MRKLDAPAAKPAPTRLPSLDDLYSDRNIIYTAISPSGRYLAFVVRRPTDDTLAVMDLQTNEKKAIQRSKPSDLGKKLVMHISTVYWKSDERLLFRVTVRPEEDVTLSPAASSKIAMLGDRLFAINRDGTKLVAMLADNRNSALEGAFDLGAIRSFLPKDPNHILMELDGFNGRSLFKVDLDTGRGEADGAPQRIRDRLVAGRGRRSRGALHGIQRNAFVFSARTPKASGKSSPACASRK